MKLPKKIDLTKLTELRKGLGLTQTAFWMRVGVSQSGGSRFESEERVIPAEVKLLLELVYLDETCAIRRLRELRGE